VLDAVTGCRPESGFAETKGEPGRLVPTQLAIEVGGAIEFLGSWRSL
jgi:hypothetical protein